MACKQNQTKDKQSSSSNVIENIKQPKTRRQTQTKTKLSSLSEVIKKETQRHANKFKQTANRHHHQDGIKHQTSKDMQTNQTTKD